MALRIREGVLFIKPRHIRIRDPKGISTLRRNDLSVTAYQKIYRESICVKLNVFSVKGAIDQLHFSSKVDDVDIGVFIRSRRVQQLDGYRHGRLGLYRNTACYDGDVQRLGISHLSGGHVQGLGGAGGVGFRLFPGQLGYSQPRAFWNAGLPVIFNFNVKSIARSIHIIGAEGIRHHIH